MHSCGIRYVVIVKVRIAEKSIPGSLELNPASPWPHLEGRVRYEISAIPETGAGQQQQEDEYSCGYHRSIAVKELAPPVLLIMRIPGWPVEYVASVRVP